MNTHEDIIQHIAQLQQEIKKNSPPTNFDEMYLKTFGKLPPKEEEKKEEQPSLVDSFQTDDGKNLSLFEEKETYQVPTYKFIGIAFSTYIILEMDKELYILDQHAARSYALSKIETSTESYDLVTDITNQVYITTEDMQEKWGEDYENRSNI